MTRARWNECFKRSIRLAAATGALCAATVTLRGERPARACAGGESSIIESTLFDPGVLGDGLDAMYYDPYHAGFGGYRPDFGEDALVADWRGYLGGAVADADWRKVLFEADTGELAALRNKLAGKPAAVPRGYERSSLWKAAATPAVRDRLIAALGVVELARQVEPSAASDEAWPVNPPARPRPGAKLLDAARAGMTAAAGDAFLAQRYAFQAVRILYYQRDAAALAAFVDQHAAVLDGPSPALRWRARYYLGGALSRTDRARASLELARIQANYPPLAGAAAGDFHPQDDRDWRAALKLARTPREQTELWRLVGLKFDGLAAMREIIKLDARSNLLAVLMVRELARAEDKLDETWGPPDPDRAEAGQRALAALEELALQLAATPGADRPWAMHLIAGHIAAMRGDLATARSRLARALAGKPGDARVASQAKASLALALSKNWKIDAAHEAELADAMMTLDASFQRSASVEQRVRDRLATLYLAAGRLVDAEYLHPGTVDPGDASGYFPHPGKLHWADASFIRDILARPGKSQSLFDHFVAVQRQFSEPALEQELALRLALDGDFAGAQHVFETTKATSTRLEVDPFVTHIKDCRECDEQKYAKTPWTHASVIARLARLAVTASGTGDAAAEASIQIGNALYNFTSYGNARRVLRGTHQDTYDARPAERWYKRAYELAKRRELKARAAYLAAKAERGILIDAPPPSPDAVQVNPGMDGELPVPDQWFTRLKQLSDTRYYKEVLRECGTFRTWSARPASK